MHENKLSNLKKIGAQDQLEVGVSQDRDKKSSRSKGSKSRFFDYKWLKIANKDKKATPGASSKKKSSLCKSSRVIEGHQENFKSFSLNKLIPKLSLISKDHIACSERSPLPSKRRQRTRQSPPKSSSKKSKRELLSKRSQKGHSESNIVSHLLLPQTSLSRDKFKQQARSQARLKLRGTPVSSTNLFTKTNSLFNSTSRLRFQAPITRQNCQLSRKREFSKSLHEKVLNKITSCHERLSSNGLHPKDLGQFNLELFKESWKKSSNLPLKTMRNQSSFRLEPMQSLTHRRNLSSLSKKSKPDLEKKSIEKGSHQKKKNSSNSSKECSERPVMALLSIMNADTARLRHSVAIEGFKYLKKTTPIVSKKANISQKKGLKQP